MKLLASLFSVAALSLSLSTGAVAAEKKAKTPAAETAKPAPAEAAKTDAKAGPKAGKPIPMYSEVDSIDAASKSFTHKNKDGKEVKFVLSATAEVKNNGADAKFEDIKVGDYVSGLRLKKSETEYEVTKITKFGAATPKKDKKAEKKQ